jgi:CRP-like cAMP-binding protein
LARLVTNREEELGRVPLFSDLTKRQLRRLAGKLKERQFDPGMTPVREGFKSGLGFFIVASGEATVSREGHEIGTLGPGDHFGELALITGRERTATVTANTPLVCFDLAVWDFQELVKADGEVSWKLLRHVVTQLLDEPASVETH